MTAVPSRDPHLARRNAVLESALSTFARFGYRKTSMDDVAVAARISRPGLYFLFASKPELFRAAVDHALTGDLAAAERILQDAARPRAERLLAAFDHWAGRYVGPVARDIAGVVEDNADLLGPVANEAPARFAELVTIAVTTGRTRADRARGQAVADTLLSASIGIKHQVEQRADYLKRLGTAIDLLIDE